jgi:cell fate regulator YaaT (PSP1 superfamily)
VTDGDRAFDIGRVSGVARALSSPQGRNPQIIRRLAHAGEIGHLAEKERTACEIGQDKVDELCLPMVIKDAHWQFEGCKLTFFYSSPDRVDFRCLQWILFRVFPTRIWLQSV